jgi:hypothetical protein
MSTLLRPLLYPGRTFVVVFASIMLCGCRPAELGPLQESTFVLEKGTVKHANLELNMKAGELQLSGGAPKLIDAHFEYHGQSAKPMVRSSLADDRATLTISQPERWQIGGNGKNRWDLRLNDDPVLDLQLHCGAGKAQMDLGSVHLRSLEVHMGAGEIDLDLSGKPRQDYEVEIHGGIGKATVRLPQEVGIWAEAHGGIGSIKVEGLEKKGDHYENQLYDTAKVNVRFEVTGGIGEIRLID